MSMDAATRTALQRVDDPFGLLALLTITGPGITEPVRVVNDVRGPETPLFMSRGLAFVALPFELTPPKEASKEVPRAQLRIDNVGRELTADLEALPPGAELVATIERVYRARPDEVVHSFKAPMSGVSVNVFSVTASIGQSDVLRRAAVLRRFDPFTAPGMFPG
jgi:hypothetical protein